jgi:exodeoxyribonuclease-5
MAFDITNYLSSSKKGGISSKGDLPKNETLASKLWALGCKVPSDKLTELTGWLNMPTISGYYRIKLIIDTIPGADKLLCKELPNYPFDTARLVRKFRELESKDAQWTGDQIKTARRIFRFLASKETLFRINGEGGTGKTTLIIELTLFLARMGLVFRIALVAPTNQALNVMESRFATCADSAVLRITKFESVHKLLGYECDFADDGEQTFVQRKKINLAKFDLIVIDEISMVAEEQAELVIKTPIAKIILSGDGYQLPPVNEADSVLCEDKRIKLESTMRQTVRNADPGVIKLFRAMRKWIATNKMPDWKSLKCDKVKFYGSKKFPSKLDTDWMKSFLKSDCGNPIILTWTRRQRDEYNTYIRGKLLGKNLKRFEVGERLILNDFYKIPETEKTPLCFHSAQQIEVVACKETTVANLEFSDIYPKKPEFGSAIRVERDYRNALVSIRRVIGSTYKVWKLNVKKMGEAARDDREFIINVMHETSEEKRKSEMKLARRYIMNLQNSIGKWNKSAIRTVQMQIIKPLWKELHRVLTEPFASVERGFSTTVHRAQGQSFGSVWADLQDILQNPNHLEAKKCLYTAASRSSKSVNFLL